MHRLPLPVLTVLFVVPMSIGIWNVALALGDKPGFVTAMNIGKAYLENRNSAKAVETFRDVVDRFPPSAAANRNLARAYLLALKTENAIEALARAAELDPESTATNYLTGIAYARLSRFAEALPYFETAVRLDPTTPALRFQLANVYQNTEQHDKSIEQLKETIRIDPLHASAYYRLGSYARKAGNRDEFQKRYREFMRLRKLFGDETRSAEALERCAHTLPEPPPIDPAHRAETERKRSPSIEVRFTDRTDEAFVRPTDRAAAAAAVIDVDEKGRCTLFVAAPDGACSLLTMSAENKFQRVPVQPKLTRLQNVSCCIVGDFHDDVPEEAKYDPKVHAHNDVLLIASGKLHLLKRTGSQTFQDVTQQAGLSGLTGRRAAWIDYDHDGDLDLFVAGDEGLEVRQNNGNGQFESVTTDVGITSTGPTLDVVGVDLDSNVAVDVVATRGDQPTVVFENQRAGRFAPMPDPPGPWPAARRILVNDVNNDGHPDAILIADQEATVLLGQTPDRQHIDLGGLDVASAVLIDFDNDGWLDLCAVGAKRDNSSKGAMQLWRNLAGEDWEDVTETTGLAAIELPPLREALAADLDVDGDTDLLLITADQRLKYIRNDGGNANGQLKLRLIAIKSNPSSLGTHIEWRKGESWVTRTVSRLPIEIGLGDLKQLDTIQTIWTNGVVDNQIGVTPTLQPLTIIEKNVRTGSCPFLFAWDGRRFRFITDVLGNSPLGLSLRRDVILPADPDELVVIGNAETLAPRAGSYELELATCFREVLYLDHVRLVAVDHDPDLEIHVTDKLMPPPFPPSELWALRSPTPLIRAIGDDGIDRTEAVRAIDDVYAPPGRLLPSPYRGMCAPMSLTLDFGRLDPGRPLVLALTGWLRYGDASANIAMSQNTSLEVIPPTLEAETAPDVWTSIDLVVGMPAGNTKTILCDLSGKLPPGARRLRLTTTFEIRWDRIALFEGLKVGRLNVEGSRLETTGSPGTFNVQPSTFNLPTFQPSTRNRTGATPPDREVSAIELAPSEATLRWYGFAELKSRAPGHPTTPDYDTVFERPPWRTTPQGWCTRYGDVLELLADRDDRLVIINAGDTVRLRFDAGRLPPVADGLTRTFLFYSVGWEKDADYNCVDGDTVAPLPVIEEGDLKEPDDDAADWRLRYNTRWVPFDRFDETR